MIVVSVQPYVDTSSVNAAFSVESTVRPQRCFTATQSGDDRGVVRDVADPRRGDSLPLLHPANLRNGDLSFRLEGSGWLLGHRP